MRQLFARRISDKNIISLPDSTIEAIFLICLSQLVDMFRELQFCIPNEMLSGVRGEEYEFLPHPVQET
jgi:hypothetical protein